MDEQPDFDFEDEYEFQQMCQEELMYLNDGGEQMDVMEEPSCDDFVASDSTSSNNITTNNGMLSSSKYAMSNNDFSGSSGSNGLYRSPEVFKQLNNEFSKTSKNRNLAPSSLSFSAADNTLKSNSSQNKLSNQNEMFSPPVQSNITARGPQIQNLLDSCLFTTQLPPFLPLSLTSISNYLDDRPPVNFSSENVLTITLDNGARKYLRPRNAATSSRDSSNNHHLGSLTDTDTAGGGAGAGGMLSRPMSEIVKEAEANKILKRAAEKTQALNKKQQFLTGASFLSSSSRSSSSNSSSSQDISAFHLDKDLWVDKYSPRSFTQLLSSEKINREVLRCVKLWDKFVFNKGTEKVQRRYYDKKGNIVTKPEFFSKMSSNNTGGGGQDSNNDSSADVMEEGERERGGGGSSGQGSAKEDSRPEFKLILLAGPPGTGKTTLAHIVAQHCGYRTIEVNASDDRSVESLRDIISRSMSNNTLDGHVMLRGDGDVSGDGVLGNNKPNCLILDEIDGMDGREPIDALIAIAKTSLDNNRKAKRGAGGANKKGGGSGGITLTRPVICICNDQFSPILRELRKFAQVFVFTPSTDTRLVARLKHICSLEGLTAIGTSSLSALSQASGGDIRSAINTLQFAAMRAQAAVQSNHTTPSASSTSLSLFQKTLGNMITSGLKDERQDVFQLWFQIFSFKEAAAKFSQKFQLLSGSNSGSTADTKGKVTLSASNSCSRGTHAMRVFDSVLAYNDNQLVLSGVQENYLGVRFTDPSFIRTSSAADWLSVGNVLEGKMGSGDAGSYATSGYLPAVISVVHLLCASDSSVSKVEYPRKERNYSFNKQQRENILSQFHEGSCIRSFSMGSKNAVALDCVPFLLDIIALGGSGSGSVRPGPMQMQSDPEKLRIQRVAEIMVSCGLTYERNTMIDSFYRDGKTPFQGAYQLEPAINTFTSYDEGGEEYNDRRLRYATSSEVKQLLYLEIRSRLQKANFAREHAGALQEEQGDAGAEIVKVMNNNTSGVSEQVSVTNQMLKVEKTGENVTDVEITSEGVTAASGSKRSATVSVGGASEGSEPEPLGKKSKTASTSAGARHLTSTSQTDLKNSEALKRKKAIRYKFCSGYSNAVKRPVSIKEFL